MNIDKIFEILGGIFLVLDGIWLVVSSYLKRDSFYTTFALSSDIVRLLGRGGYRIFFLLLGIVTIILGIIMFLVVAGIMPE
jgi:hypothetical protein